MAGVVNNDERVFDRLSSRSPDARTTAADERLRDLVPDSREGRCTCRRLLFWFVIQLMSSRFALGLRPVMSGSSGGQYKWFLSKSDHASSYDLFPKPYIDPSTKTEVVVSIEDPAYLHCIVQHQRNYQVSR
ncbi:unnamed protein product [Soboliphyme baturini]|uniref:Ig-like domain-containing protein n=1 Tax=Soboliphyme baturini TaxID=241478 RepID=A0A183IB61_9BILA|nr:unnamed protein product [Soboliphyme baturini]